MINITTQLLEKLAVHSQEVANNDHLNVMAANRKIRKDYVVNMEELLNIFPFVFLCFECRNCFSTINLS